MAIFWGEPFVHCEQSYRSDGQQDPQSVNQIDLDPESNDDTQNHKIIEGEYQSAET
jgi:hypothetical protein